MGLRKYEFLNDICRNNHVGQFIKINQNNLKIFIVSRTSYGNNSPYLCCVLVMTEYHSFLLNSESHFIFRDLQKNNSKTITIMIEKSNNNNNKGGSVEKDRQGESMHQKCREQRGMGDQGDRRME